MGRFFDQHLPSGDFVLASVGSKGRRSFSGSWAIAASLALLTSSNTGTRAAPQGSPASAQTVATAQLDDSIPPTQNNQVHSTVVFFSENSLALELCGNGLNSNCQLIIVELTGGSIHVLARTKNLDSGATLVRSGDGFILEPNSYGHPAQFYTRGLGAVEQIPAPRYVSLSGRTIAVLTKASTSPHKNEWALYSVPLSIPATIEKLRDIVGDLQAVGDDKLVMRTNNTMQTETLDGKVLGAFAVKPRSKAQTDVQFAGEDRLYVSTWHRDRIVDFSGKKLVKLPAPSGWGFRRVWSTSGKRLVYDQYTRKIPFLRGVGETVLALATLGAGAVDQDPNGEAIRVIDTTTGNVCFDWNEPKHLTDMSNHADISPDGKLVAVVKESTLTIYRLPDSCGQK